MSIPLALISAAVLSACGGGGGGTNGAATEAASSGGKGAQNLASAPSESGSGESVQALATPSTITVRARGELAANVGPMMKLRVNGAEVGAIEVRSSTFTTYSFTAEVPPGAKVDVVFDNDYVDNNGDRNLFVESIVLNGTTIEATAPGVVFDLGTGAGAFDGANVIPGRSALFWAGALRFTAASVATDPGTVVVRARGELAANVGPIMKLRVNGTEVGVLEVRASAYTDYSFNPVVPPSARVEVVFDNDYVDNTGDRNLFVESITINNSTTAANAEGVVFDRGPGDQAFDNLDVIPGLSTLYWGGALRFKAPPLRSRTLPGPFPPAPAPAPAPTPPLTRPHDGGLPACPASNAVGVEGIGDGCTTYGAEYAFPNVGAFRSTFTPACNSHDKCYSTLGTSYAECDGNMLRDMQSACGDVLRGGLGGFNPLRPFPPPVMPNPPFIPSPPDPVQYALCMETAKQYEAAVSLYGQRKNPLPGIQLEALRRSRAMEQQVSQGVCQTTPQDTTLYSADLVTKINSAFQSFQGRLPSTEEFFRTVNFGGQTSNLVTNYAAWEAALPANASTPAPTPPTTSHAGPCSPDFWRLAPCHPDAIAFDSDLNQYSREIWITRGQRWTYDAAGDLVEVVRLTDIPHYAAGPCAAVSASQDCRLDSLTILNHPVYGYIESVSAYGRAWNFKRDGSEWVGASNLDLRSVPRYAPFCPPGGGACSFDTRELIDARAEWGDIFEGISANGRYYIFRWDGTYVGGDTLLSVRRYAAGPCAYLDQPTSRPGEVCHFAAAEKKRVGGKLVEVIVSNGRYWEFGEGDTPLPGSGRDLKAIPKYANPTLKVVGSSPSR